MKKNTIIFVGILFILFNSKINSQIQPEKFELPKIDTIFYYENIELPKLEIHNESLIEEIMSNIIKKNKLNHGFYLLEMEKDEQRHEDYIIITIHQMGDIRDKTNIGFFYIEKNLFVLRGNNFNDFYFITEEKRIFEFKGYDRIRDGLIVELPMIWEPPVWTFLYKEGKVKLLKYECFN